MRYIKPSVPRDNIKACLEMFDKEEALNRICKYIQDTVDDAENQFNNHNLRLLNIFNQIIASDNEEGKRKYEEAKKQLVELMK